MSLAWILLAWLSQRRLGTSCRSQKVQLKAQQCAPQDIQVWESSNPPTHRPSNPPSHHHTTSPSAQQATKPSRLHPLPHPEGYANSNYLPLRVDWVTYLNWFSRWGSCGKLPHLTAPSPAHTVLLGLSVLGPWLVSRTQHSQMSQSAFHCSLSWRIYDGYFTQNRLPQSGLSARIQIARERAKTPVRSIINIALLLSSGYDVP